MPLLEASHAPPSTVLHLRYQLSHVKSILQADFPIFQYSHYLSACIISRRIDHAPKSLHTHFSSATHPVPILSHFPQHSHDAHSPSHVPNLSYNSHAAYATPYTACSHLCTPQTLNQTPLAFGTLGTHILSNQVTNVSAVYELHSTNTQLV